MRKKTQGEYNGDAMTTLSKHGREAAWKVIQAMPKANQGQAISALKVKRK